MILRVSLFRYLPDFFGEPGGIRTRDPLIKSQVLYRLSYGLGGRATIGGTRCAVNLRGPSGHARFARDEKSDGWPMAAPENLFADLPQHLASEEFRDLFAAPGLRIERIVSTGQVTPQGEWLEQAWGEWVILLQGAARLRIAGEAAAVTLLVGDYLHIARGTRHRVEWTDPAMPTVWLAVHYG